MKNDRFRILSQINDAAGPEALWDLTVRHFTDEGFGAIAYLLFDRGRLNEALAFFEHGFPPAVVSVFSEMGFGRKAPVVRIAMTSGVPMLAGQPLKAQSLSPEEQAHREAIFAAGLNEVLTIPLYGPMGRNGILFLSEAADPEVYAEAGWDEHQMIAQTAHLRALGFTRKRAVRHGLSPREVQILRCVAQGKNNVAISALLGISSGTVDTYLRRLFEKLDVADRTMAAVKGFSLGLIQA